MHSDRVLVFDVSGEYGHFRKFNTTTSPLTYSIPTRPAITGLIGAVMGIERELSANKYADGVVPVSEIFPKETSAIGVQILRPVKKVKIAFNLLDTKKTPASFFNIQQRTQIEYELLKNPSFRIFINVNDGDLLQRIAERLETNQSHFTPYLGLSQFTAITRFVTITKLTSIPGNDYLPTLTAVNLANADPEEPIRFDRSSIFKYTAETMPVEMQRDRTVTEYAEVIVETYGRPVLVRSANLYHAESFGNILFL